jgi:hypothetical protein
MFWPRRVSYPARDRRPGNRCRARGRSDRCLCARLALRRRRSVKPSSRAPLPIEPRWWTLRLTTSSACRPWPRCVRSHAWPATGPWCGGCTHRRRETPISCSTRALRSTNPSSVPSPVSARPTGDGMRSHWECESPGCPACRARVSLPRAWSRDSAADRTAPAAMGASINVPRHTSNPRLRQNAVTSFPGSIPIILHPRSRPAARNPPTKLPTSTINGGPPDPSRR